MDILVSSNLERLLFEISGRDEAQVRRWMDELAATGRYEIGEEWRAALEADFYADCCTEDEAAQSIARLWHDERYLIDTHTAVAQCVYERYRRTSGDERQSVVVSTASPFKFAFDVLRAIGDSDLAAIDENDAFAAADALAKKTGIPVPKRIDELRSMPVVHNDRCEKHDMQSAVTGILGRW